MPELERKKTGGLTVLGVASVVIGAFGVATFAWAVLAPEVVNTQVDRAGVPRILTGTGLAAAYLDATVNLALAALLFAAGVGLLKLRKWGAKLARWYAFGRIGWSAVAAVLAFIGPFANRGRLEDLGPKQAEKMADIFGPISATLIVGGFVLSVTFAVILLCLLSRKTYQDNLS